MLNPTKSIASISSTSSASAPSGQHLRERTATKRSTIIISSDEEDELEDDNDNEANDIVEITETYVP